MSDLTRGCLATLAYSALVFILGFIAGRLT